MEKYNDNKEFMQSKSMTETVGLDLEQMREQLGILKQKLDEQTIVTDRLIHQAMKQKMSWITKYCWFAALVMFPAICVLGWEVKNILGISIFSYFLYIVLMGGAVASDIIVNRMKPADWENENLVQTGVKLVKMKRTRKMQVCLQAVVFVLVLLVWGYDTYTAGVVPHERMKMFGISCVIGLVVGGFIGLRILAKMQRTNDDIIQQIEELNKEKITK